MTSDSRSWSGVYGGEWFPCGNSCIRERIKLPASMIEFVGVKRRGGVQFAASFVDHSTESTTRHSRPLDRRAALGLRTLLPASALQTSAPLGRSWRAALLCSRLLPGPSAGRQRGPARRGRSRDGLGHAGSVSGVRIDGRGGSPARAAVRLITAWSGRGRVVGQSRSEGGWTESGADDCHSRRPTERTRKAPDGPSEYAIAL
jgi:hypothetical protein